MRIFWARIHQTRTGLIALFSLSILRRVASPLWVRGASADPSAEDLNPEEAFADHQPLADLGPYFVAKLNAGASGASHLNLAIVEQIATTGLMFGQVMRLQDLDPAGRGGGTFRVGFNKRGNVYELEHQVIRDFVGRQRIDRVDQHCYLCHSPKIINNGCILPAAASPKPRKF
jgi:hypothetical protein